MSIVRVGMAEDKTFGDGWDAIFSKKKAAPKKPEPAKAEVKAVKKPAKKKAN